MFKFGDKVIVRRNTNFPNSNVIMRGWTGVCLYDEYTDSIGTIVHVVWDDVTLDRMPPDHKAYCKKYKISIRFHIIPANQLLHDKG